MCFSFYTDEFVVRCLLVLGVPLGVALEMSFKSEVVTPGVPVLPAAVDIGTWVVSVDPSSTSVRVHYVHQYSQYTLRITALYECTVLTIPVLTTFTAGCRLMLGPLTAHTFTL